MDFFAVDANKMHALHHAISARPTKKLHCEVSQFLIKECQIDVHSRTSEGLTCFDLAEGSKFKETLRRMISTLSKQSGVRDVELQRCAKSFGRNNIYLHN